MNDERVSQAFSGTGVDWEPISREQLQGEIDRGLELADAEIRAFYEEVSRELAKWQLHPWGDLGGGFWVVAVFADRALWYNDIEGGFNVSTFKHAGSIPSDQYWANQDELHWALARLRDGGGSRLGPPESPDA